MPLPPSPQIPSPICAPTLDRCVAAAMMNGEDDDGAGPHDSIELVGGTRGMMCDVFDMPTSSFLATLNQRFDV